MIAVLRAALAPLAREIATAFIYGPGARPAQPPVRPSRKAADGADAVDEDDIYGRGAIDIMLVGTALTYVDLIPHLVPVERRTGRKISLSIYSAEEFSRKLDARNIVAVTVMKQAKIFLLGSDATLPGVN